jgi:hypothetical protein
MKLPIQFGGTYHWQVRDAQTNTIVQESEKHNIVVLDGWKTLLDFEYRVQYMQNAEIILSEEIIAEDETATDIPEKKRGTIVNTTVINAEEMNTPKNFIYHFQFAIPTTSKSWKSIGLYLYPASTLLTLTSLSQPIVQLGNDSPTPQILDLYYTLYFDYDKNVDIVHSKNGAAVLGNLVNQLADRCQSLDIPNQYQAQMHINPFAYLCKTFSNDIKDYTVRDFNDDRQRSFRDDKTLIAMSNDLNNIFNKKVSLNLANGDGVGFIYGSVEMVGNVINNVTNRDYGIIWPVTNNPAIKPIQNVFSHKPPTVAKPERPFEYEFRSTGRLVFDDSTLDISRIPQWYQLNFINSGNTTDNSVRFSLKTTNFLGLRGNTYETSYYYSTPNNQYNYNDFSVGNLVYPNAIPDCQNIGNFKYAYSMYNEKEIVWFGETYVVKQNIINGDYKKAKAGVTAGFAPTKIHQLAVITPTATVDALIFAGCSETGVWMISEDFATIAQVDTSALAGVSDKCYGISIGYQNRVWALMEGGLIYSDNMGTSWSVAVFTCAGISDDKWDSVNKMYAGRGTNRHVLLFVIDDMNGNGNYIWFKAGSNTTPGNVQQATGYVLANGPCQIKQIDGYDCFLVRPMYDANYVSTTSNFNILSYNVVNPSLYVPLAFNAVDCLYDRNGNFYPVFAPNDSINYWVKVTDHFNQCELTLIAPNQLKYFGAVDSYHSLLLMTKTQCMLLQGESTSTQPRLVTRTVKPNDYTSRVLDLQYADYRYNVGTSNFVKDYVYPMTDSTSHHYDAARVNFPVEKVQFMGGSYISTKPTITAIRNALATTGECTIAFMVRPSEILTTGNTDIRRMEVLSIQFDNNKEGIKTGSLSLQIHPEIKLTNYSTTGSVIETKFADNVVGTSKVFDTNKTCRVVLTITPGTIKLYVNGAQLGLDSVTCVGIDFTLISDIIFGQGFIRSFGLYGWMDYIQIWDKAFLATDVVFDYFNNNYVTETASKTYNAASDLLDANLLAHYRTADLSATIVNKETGLISNSTLATFDRGMKFLFEDNANVGTSFFDQDFYTFGVVDGLLKDNQVVFGEDYMITFSK